jgi:hypothetical protein
MQKKSKIEDFMPDVLINKDKYMTKAGDTFIYKYPKDSGDRNEKDKE